MNLNRDVLKHNFPIILVSLAATVLALFQITTESVWCDEGSTIFYSLKSFSDLWNSQDYTPFGYFLFEGLILRAVGISELSLRLPSAIAFIISVIMMYLLSRKIFDSEYLAVISTVLIAFSPFLLFSAQDGRPYAIDLLFSIICLYFYMDVLRDGSVKSWIKASVVSAISVYFFYLAVLPVICFLFGITVYKLKEQWLDGPLKCLTLPVLFAVLFMIICSPVIYQAFVAVQSVTKMGVWVSGSNAIVMILDAFFIYKPLAIIASLASVYGFYAMVKTIGKRESVMISLVGLGTFIALIFLSFHMRMAPRYAIQVYPYFCLALSVSLYSLVKRFDERRATIVVVVALMLIATPALYDYYVTEQKADYRVVGNAISEKMEAGDCLIYSPNYDDLLIGPIFAYCDLDSQGIIYVGASSIEEITSIREKAEYPHYYLLLSSELAGQDDYVHSVIEWVDTDSAGTLVASGYCTWLYELV